MALQSWVHTLTTPASVAVGPLATVTWGGTISTIEPTETTSFMNLSWRGVMVPEAANYQGDMWLIMAAGPEDILDSIATSPGTETWYAKYGPYIMAQRHLTFAPNAMTGANPAVHFELNCPKSLKLTENDEIVFLVLYYHNAGVNRSFSSWTYKEYDTATY